MKFRQPRTLLLLALFSFATACQRIPESGSVFTGETMGTTYRIRVYPTRNKQALSLSAEEVHRQLQEEMDHQVGLFSNWVPESDISRFNAHHSPTPFTLNKETAIVIKNSLRLADLTGGAFDPTLGELIELHGFGKRKITLPPTPQEIREAREDSGYRQLRLEGNQLSKLRPRLALNLSAVAKGYTVDAVFHRLEKMGFQSFLVEIGGELRVKGHPPGKEYWRIGIEQPDYNESGRSLHAVAGLRDLAMATSGDYRNYRTQGGKRYSHILDPKTGRSVRTVVASATVVGPACLESDALATALMVLGTRRALRLIEKLPGFEALILEHHGDGFREFKSSGMGRLIVQE